MIEKGSSPREDSRRRSANKIDRRSFLLGAGGGGLSAILGVVGTFELRKLLGKLDEADRAALEQYIAGLDAREAALSKRETELGRKEAELEERERELKELEENELIDTSGSQERDV